MTAKLAEARARNAAYELLSLGFLYPEKDLVTQLQASVQKTSQLVSYMGWSDVRLALNGLSSSLVNVDDRGLEDQYIGVFGHTISTDCPPYEGEYGQAHVFQKSHALADLKAFYEAFGVGLNPNLKERQDHISVELEFMSLLSLKEAYALLNDHGEDKVALCHRAQEFFLSTHLANWVGAFIKRLARKAGDAQVYTSLTHLLDAHMTEEMYRFNLSAAPLSLTKTADESTRNGACYDCQAQNKIPEDEEVVGQCE